MAASLVASVELREDPDSPYDDYYHQTIKAPLQEEEWEQFKNYILYEREWPSGALQIKFNISGESGCCRTMEWIPWDKTEAEEMLSQVWQEAKKLSKNGTCINYP